MMGTTQPIDYLISKDKAQNNPTLLDMIVTVCCALTNLCNSVILLINVKFSCEIFMIDAHVYIGYFF